MPAVPAGGGPPRYHRGAGAPTRCGAGRDLARRARTAHRRRVRADQDPDPVEGPRDRAGRHPQGGSGAEHLHLLHRIRAEAHGGRAGVFHQPRRPELLQRLHQWVPHRRGRGESPSPAGVHPRQWIHVSRVLSCSRHGHRPLHPEPELLLQQRDGRGVQRDRACGTADMGGGAVAAIRREHTQSDVEVPHSDQRSQPPRPGDRVQRHPDHAPGPAGRLRQRPEPSHQRVRRGDHHAYGGIRAPSDGDPVDHQQGVRVDVLRERHPGQFHRRGADGPGGRSRSEGVRSSHRARRRVGRHGASVSAGGDPG